MTDVNEMAKIADPYRNMLSEQQLFIDIVGTAENHLRARSIQVTT